MPTTPAHYAHHSRPPFIAVPAGWSRTRTLSVGLAPPATSYPAQVWDLDPAAKAKAAAKGRQGSRGGGGNKAKSGEESPDLTIHQAGPDGKTQAMNLGKLTPELLAKLKGQGVM